MDVDCEECGGSFECETRDDRQSIDGFTKVECWPVTNTCPACANLGQPPPACAMMGCGGKLRGNRDGSFSCEDCDAEYPVEIVRALMLGRAVAHILKERPTIDQAKRQYGEAGASERASEILALVIAAARILGVRRG